MNIFKTYGDLNIKDVSSELASLIFDYKIPYFHPGQIWFLIFHISNIFILPMRWWLVILLTANWRHEMTETTFPCGWCCCVLGLPSGSLSLSVVVGAPQSELDQHNVCVSQCRHAHLPAISQHLHGPLQPGTGDIKGPWPVLIYIRLSEILFLFSLKLQKRAERWRSVDL